MTIRHIVAWQLATGDTAERAAQAARITAELGALRGVVPEILEITVGPDIVGDGNWDVALIVDVADRAALDAYQRHPAHQAVVAYVRSVVSGRVAVDVEV
ncbi:MAG: Dabb family protein [Microbacterium sp.]|uniref:Dabb family protein n=1 Tax=Microbacterium sp. TaxID=51671 RepID=UPI0039E6AA55